MAFSGPSYERFHGRSLSISFLYFFFILDSGDNYDTLYARSKNCAQRRAKVKGRETIACVRGAREEWRRGTELGKRNRAE